MTLSGDTTLLTLLRTSHTVGVRAVLTSVSNVDYDLPVLGGSVTVDARRAVRRNLSLQTIDLNGSLTDTLYTGPLSPFGARVRIYRGVVDPAAGVMTSSTEVLLGTFWITSVDLNIDSDGAINISISAEDSAYYIARLRFSQALEIPAGTKISDPSTSAPGAMQLILNNVSGGTAFSRDLPTTTTTLSTYKWFGSDPEEDPWIALSMLAQAVGYEVYMSNTDIITASIPPALGTFTPDWEYLQDENNVVLSMTRTMSAEDIANGVQMQSQADAYAQGEYFDTNPASPTNSLNPLFGRRPVRIDSPYVSSSSQASIASQRLLSVYTGQPISWQQIPNPAMDVRDRVRIVESRLDFDAVILVDAFTIPLDATGTMQVEGRIV